MDFDLLAALGAGFVATLAMTALIAMARAAGMTRMPSFEMLTGSMMSGNPATARAMGVVIHYIVMGTIVFGIIYALLFTVFNSASWWVGLLIGVVHGIVVGLIMGMMPAMHPRMGRPSAAQPNTSSVTTTSNGVRLSAPGLFGTRWGAMTPAGVLIGHAVYGVVLALVYTWLT